MESTLSHRGKPRHRHAAALIALLAAACNPAAPDGKGAASAVADGLAPDPTLRPVATPAKTINGQWREEADAGLSFASDSAHLSIQLRCARGVLTATLPGVRPIASEERLSFGGGGYVVALVADPAAADGGVQGSGGAPPRLEAMLHAGPGASYGATAIGPLPPVEAASARRFAASCGKPEAISQSAPCHVQDGKPVALLGLRAIGTEPLWGAAIDGRCVTYSTPEEPKGLRVWTRATGGTKPSFVGAPDGKPFRLDLAKARCSDGMSDREYDWTATLVVRGETRRGCAADMAP